MIYVERQPEPPNFDEKVRQKGLAYLRKFNLPLDKPIPSGTKLQDYWRDCLDDLYSSYGGICAYLAIHFERVTGGGVVEHFLPKSKRTDLIYEWSNYRLASSIVNSCKSDYVDILDPFEIEDDWFCLEFVTGRIYPNPNIESALQNEVQVTIDRLKLDNEMNRKMRVKHYQDYHNGEYPAQYLKRISPFVYKEANRQNLL